MEKLIYTLIIALSLLACQSRGPGGHTHDVIGTATADHSHGPTTGTGLNALSYTLFSNGMELFVEFNPLIMEEESSFAAHFTRLADYKPLTEGEVSVTLISEDDNISNTVSGPSSPGIFRPVLTPENPGEAKIVFKVNLDHTETEFHINDLMVYHSEEEALKYQKPDAANEEITYLKEQAWKTEFATREINTGIFYDVIKTAAKVKPQPQATRILSASATGKVNLLVMQGKKVNKGELLAIISASGIDNNLSARFSELQVNYKRSKADYERLQSLFKNQASSEKDFLNAQTKYLQDSIRYFHFSSEYKNGGLKIIAPSGGVLSKVAVQNGEYVRTGESLLTIVSDQKLIIEALVSQNDYAKLDELFDANFSIPSLEETFSLKDLNGQILTKGSHVQQNRIPVTFSVNNNGKLLNGMYLEAYLQTGIKENAITVPLSALMEDQGNYYLYIQTGTWSVSDIPRPVGPGSANQLMSMSVYR